LPYECSFLTIRGWLIGAKALTGGMCHCAGRQTYAEREAGKMTTIGNVAVSASDTGPRASRMRMKIVEASELAAMNADAERRYAAYV
jgi:hypothetical protein